MHGDARKPTVKSDFGKIERTEINTPTAIPRDATKTKNTKMPKGYGPTAVKFPPILSRLLYKVSMSLCTET